MGHHYGPTSSNIILYMGMGHHYGPTSPPNGVREAPRGPPPPTYRARSGQGRHKEGTWGKSKLPELEESVFGSPKKKSSSDGELSAHPYGRRFSPGR